MSASSTYRILLENTAEGKALATVLELPECRVMADTIDTALIEVQQQLNRRLAKTEVVSIQVPNNSIQTEHQNLEHPMLKFAGIFKDDPDFAVVMASIKEERAITAVED
jgi:predicted RNase H-like HicB family nuclease